MNYEEKYKAVEKTRCILMSWLDAKIELWEEVEVNNKEQDITKRRFVDALKMVERRAKQLGYKTPEIRGDC
jgi:hypothetical protein